MKTKILIGIFLILFIFSLFIFNVKTVYSFKENVLYTQENVTGYNETETESDNLVNRNEAIKIAKYYISDILGNDIEKLENKMYVNLYKNDSSAESYYWNISWFSEDLSYSVEINTINKSINSININKDISKDMDKKTTSNTKLTKSSVLKIVNKLTNSLEIDINSYNLDIYEIEYNNDEEFCLFTNKNNSKDKFLICISKKGKYITRYTENP